LQRFSTWDFDAALDVRDLPAADLGDLPLSDVVPEDALRPTADAVGQALATASAAVLLGGDNSITRPGVHGLALPLDRCGLLTVDAHLDLRSLDGGLSNGNLVRALLSDGLPGANIVQIGIQSFANSPDYAAVASSAGIRVVTASEVRTRGIELVVGEALAAVSDRADAIYVDLDLDAMDRAFAPGTPGARPGGLTPGDLRVAAHLCGSHAKVRALDLVELDPEKDTNQITALTAAACLLSFASGVLCRPR
jgi:arginase family enzyme